MKFDKSFIQQTLVFLSVLVNTMIISCAVTWLTNTMIYVTEPTHVPSLTVEECGWLVTIIHFGRFLLAIPAGFLVDMFGRKRITLILGILNSVTWIILSLSKSIPLIFVVRFAQGIGISLLNCTVFSMIGEISNPEFRAMFTGFYRIALSSGSLILGFFVTIFDSYSLLNYATTVLSFVFFVSIYWLIETPYYLIGKGRYDKGLRNLRTIRVGKSELEITIEFEEIRESIEKDKLEKSQISWWRYVSSKSNRRTLVCIILINFLLVGTGHSSILLYCAVIFPENSYFPNRSYPFVIGMISLVSTFGSSCILDFLPRRFLFMSSAFLCFLAHILNWISLNEIEKINDGSESEEIWKLTFLGGNVFFMVILNAIVLPLNSVVRSEILSFGCKGIGNSLASLSQAFSGMLTIQIFVLIDKHFGMSLNYFSFAVISLVLVVTIYILLPETRGKTLAEVQKTLKTASIKNKSQSANKEQQKEKIEKY